MPWEHCCIPERCIQLACTHRCTAHKLHVTQQDQPSEADAATADGNALYSCCSFVNTYCVVSKAAAALWHMHSSSLKAQ